MEITQAQHNLGLALVALREAVTHKQIARKQAPFMRTIEQEAARFFRKQGIAVGRAYTVTRLQEAAIDDVLAGTDIGKLAAAIARSYVGGMAFAGAEYALGINFTLKNPRAVAYQKDRGVELLKELNKTTKSDINELIINGLEHGLSPQVIERSIRSLFVSYAATKRGKRSRAQLVAITETARAYSAGNHGAILDASGTGLAFEKSWLTANDDRVDPHCSANQAQGWIAMGADHSSGAQYPPDHPGCRCVERYQRIKADPSLAAPPSATTITSTRLPEDHPLLKRFGIGTGQYRQFTDPMSTDQVFGEKYFRTWEQSLETDQRDAVRGYQQQTFGLINDTLRGHRREDDKTSYAHAQAALLDQALARGEMPMNVLAFRGLVDPDLAVGDIFTDHGYSSTTLAPSIAVARAKGHTKGAVARIKIPQGQRGAYIETVSPIDQAEILLPRGTRFKIISTSEETIAGKVVRVIDMEIAE